MSYFRIFKVAMTVLSWFAESMEDGVVSLDEFLELVSRVADDLGVAVAIELPSDFLKSVETYNLKAGANDNAS